MQFSASKQKKLIWSSVALTALIAAASAGFSRGGESPRELPKGVERLLKAYPQQLCTAGSGKVLWCDGAAMDYDDGRSKTFEQKLKDADLEDQMSIEYPAEVKPSWPEDFDPGRIRCEPFFKKMYGGDEAEVREKLRPVPWLPGISRKTLMVTSVNGVDEKLESISAEILKLPRVEAEKVKDTAGAFVWRNVRKEERLSAHSFGIAVDVGGMRADYWRWFKPGPDGLLKYRNRIPLEVVEIFEKHGFIWGGKWYHFDTMHFEYRPELAPVQYR